MSFENVKVIDPYVENGMLDNIELTLATLDEVKEVEAKLNISFPAGYKEYVITFGRGDYCNYIRIDMPDQILSEYEEYQRFLDQYWFWEMGEEVLAKEKAVESIKIGSTIDGDVMIFHPNKSDELFVLPRHDDMLYRIGSDLYEAIDWLCVSRSYDTGSVGETHERRYFVPWNRLVETHGWIFVENN